MTTIMSRPPVEGSRATLRASIKSARGAACAFVKSTWETYRVGVPSTISIARFASFYYLPLLVRNDYLFAFFAVAIAAAVSDWVDGLLARRWDCATKFGAVCDLLGDKGLCFTLMYLGLDVWRYRWYYLVPCAVLALYHATVMGLRAVGVVRASSSRVAKIKFFIEATGWVMCFSSFSLGYLFVWADGIGITLVWTASFLAGWSMFEYFGLVPDLPKKYYPRKL